MRDESGDTLPSLASATAHGLQSIDDELFLRLAAAAGMPSKQVLDGYRDLQRDRAARGKPIGLFQLVCESGVLTLEEEEGFRRNAARSQVGTKLDYTPTSTTQPAADGSGTTSQSAASPARPSTTQPMTRTSFPVTPPPSSRSETVDEPLKNSLMGGELQELADQFAAPPRVIIDAPALDEIECPRCAERIKARAKVCRYCGHELESQGRAGTTSEATAKSGTKARLTARRSSAMTPALPGRSSSTEIPARPRRSKAVLGALISSLLAGGAAVTLVAIRGCRLQMSGDSYEEAHDDSRAQTERLRKEEREREERERAEREHKLRIAEQTEAERGAARRAALEQAKTAEQKGNVQEALEALDLAELNGASPADIDLARVRLKARIKDEEALRDAREEVEELLATEDLDKASARAESAKEIAERLQRPQDVDSLLARIESARSAKRAAVEAESLLDQAKRELDGTDLQAAQASLDRARTLAPTSPRVRLLTLRLEKCKQAAKGMAWIELNPNSAAGIYVRTHAVTNSEYKAWLDSLPIGSGRHGPWITDGFTEEQANKPVTGVKQADAEAFAAARNERLPNAAERAALRRVLGMPSSEGELDAKRGTFSSGFRTVSGPEESPAADASVEGADDQQPRTREVDAAKVRLAKQAVAARFKGWIVARKNLTCTSCGGKLRVKCSVCGGTGHLATATLGGEAQAGVTLCTRCQGMGTIACTACHNGLSATRVEQVRTRYGACGYPLVEIAEKTLQVTVDGNLKMATVTCDVRSAEGALFTTESSVWECDKDGEWHVSTSQHPRR
ncbi:MAG TPA: SUMF1/EgtB/PvdO family nonheme iron enzyme [Planctomycetota bacterium]|nr:SUMF1/EgtB/PvdO family nonheme iron enzyme [Planctomycetota bacterium]